jgi:two-component system NtrC family sensor kinase
VEDSPDDPARVPPLSDEQVRAQKLEALARIAPGITHELNNPLAAIVGFAELLRTDPRLPDDMRRQADLLASETAATQVIIQTLLEFLRPRPPERHPTSARALVDAVLLLHGYRLASGQVDVITDVPDGLPAVEVDRAGLQLVLVNLVQDGIDALADRDRPRSLGIRAASEGDDLRLTVTYEGANAPATPSPERERARRVSSAIVADHGGSLERTAEGMSLRLPATGPGRRSGMEIAPATVPARGARVLVLDDERSIGMLLERWLRSSGYEPILAASGSDAVALVGQGPFDAVLCDHRMAGMAGTEVFDEIVAVRPELERRFVFMSGDVLNPDLQRVVEERGVRLLAKPFDLDTVRQTLEAVLRT